MSLATKYRPQEFSSVCEQDTIINIVSRLCEQEDLENRNFLFIGPAGCGKAQPMYSHVLTTSGFVTMNQIQIGDNVVTSNGNVGHVVGIFPQGERPIYEITLKDGATIRVADNHLNLVVDVRVDKQHVVTTDYLRNIYEDYDIAIPVASISIYLENLKLEDPRKDSTLEDRIIKSIKYVGLEECQCIYIDHEDHTYISDDFVPTHNTTTARIMAKVLNEGKENSTIEMDAASHNGVESVREIINQARMYPVGTKYKVFIIDECFPGGIQVSTSEGKKRISDVNVGDSVAAFTSFKKVTNTFKNQVPCYRLIHLELSDGTQIVTTLEHRFYTSMGWIEAKNLKESMYLCRMDFENISDLHQPILIKSEIYNPGVNDGLFLSYFSEEELKSGTVTMYDLEVEEEHCYFVNDILVHNCHAFSPQAWQIWLKPLEDAPAKSIYIFCTTNPEKIPATIISRVQTFQLSKISLKGIFDRLCYIIEQENKEGAGITYTDDAVNYISKLASGGMRDAITNLDKVLAFTHDLTSESVAKALNLPEYDDYFKLLAAYSKKDNKIVSEVINDVYNSGVNFVKWFEGFHSFVMNVVKYIFLQDINLTMIPSHYQSKISKYGTAHSVVCLKLANKLLKLNYELKTTQYLQEVALTYLCQLPKKGE